MLTINEAAARLRSSRRHIYNLIGFGELKAFKLGRRTFIVESEIERFLGSLPAAVIKRPPIGNGGIAPVQGALAGLAATSDDVKAA